MHSIFDDVVLFFSLLKNKQFVKHSNKIVHGNTVLLFSVRMKCFNEDMQISFDIYSVRSVQCAYNAHEQTEDSFEK